MSKLAIAVIHGIGRHEKDDPEGNTATRAFSAPLYDALRLRLGDSVMADKIAWREIFWGDVLQPRQDALEQRLSQHVNIGTLRRLVLSVLGDAANYSFSTSESSTYQRIHARVAQVISELDAEAEGGPLLLVAHSLGGHILSNFIYDTVKRPPEDASSFEQFQSLAGLFTFGCNIPVFVFQHEQLEPIARPPEAEPFAVQPWWRNYYGPSDVLGYPLAPAGGGYATMAEGPDPALIDRKVRPGFPFIVSHSLLSHTAYWKSRTIHGPLEEMVREVLAKNGMGI